MRKIFLFFAAMLVALAVNATKVNITPTSPYESDAVRLALYYSAEGDTIVLAAGTYEESNSDYIAFKRHNVVMAAEGANVIIKPHVSFRVRGGARAELNGVKIDASELNTLSTSYENIFEVHDATAGNCWVLKNCEVYGNSAKTLLRHASGKTLDSVIIDGCYIHNNPQAILRLQDASLKGVIIKNSTFAEIANGGSFWCAPMDISTTAADAKVVVDHCTFYHNTSISSSYADVTTGVDGSATSDVTVSNCIIAQPEAYAGSRAINFTNGGIVKNCLVFNYTKSTNGIQGASSVNNCIYVDPLFVNAAEANYTLDTGSPALAAGTDGSNLGDPRWWPAAPATPNFYIAGIGGWNPDQVAVTGSSYTFENLAAGDYQFKITRNGTWSGENNVYGYDALTAKIGGLYRWNGGESDNNIMFTLADAGDVTVTYIEGEKFTVEGDFTIWPVELAGSWDSEWKDKKTFVPAADKMTASVTLNFTNDYYEFKVIDNGTWKGKWINNNDDKYYLTRSVLSVNSLEEGKNNIVITPDVAGDYKFTWTYGTGELTVEFPTLPNPVYYLAGSMFTDGDWSQALVAMTETDGVWSKTVNFESTDSKELKVVRSVEGIHVISQDWLGLAEAQTITATTSDLVIGTGDANIGITPSKAGAYVFAFDPDGNKLSVTYPTTTALDNTAVADKAQKFMENGQLFIRRDGKIYTTTGVQVK